MEFKRWFFEVAEPRKPNKVTRTNLIKDKGTNVARRIIQYTWTTSYGNVVKLQLEPKGEDGYFVIFYVNDVLFDYGSKLGIVGKGVDRDSDILANVFYVLKQKAESLGAKELKFSAHKSEGDTKIIRNLDIDKPRDLSIRQLDFFIAALEKYEVKFIPLSQKTIEILQKAGKPIDPRPDVNIQRWVEWANTAKERIMASQTVEFDLYGISDKIQVKPLIDALTDYNNAIQSNTPEGFRRTKNRRAMIYRRILDNYFFGWDIHQSGDSFTLVRL